MSEPDTVSTIQDAKRKITYHIIAYRPLTYQEKVSEVQAYVRQNKGKLPAEGSVVTIKTLIGVGK